MSEKGRIALIFGVVAVALGGGLFYFFKIHQPKQQQAAAQVEVEAWEKRWDEARTCLLGAAPISSNAGESLSVREMQPDPWERKTCTQLIGKLSRGVTDDTGMMNVEHAWMTIDRAASKVANAFATHVDPYGESAENRGKESPLPAALQELDTAHADLRTAAGMSPPAVASLGSLPAAELILLKDGADPVQSLDGWRLPSATGVVAFGTVKARGQVQLVLAPGAAPKVLKVPNDTSRAVPDLTWAATALDNPSGGADVTYGPIDDNGAFATMTSLKVLAYTEVALAAGTPAAGLLVFRDPTSITIARSSGGVFTQDKPVAASGSALGVDPMAGRVLFAWNGPYTDQGTGKLMGFIGRGDAAPTIVQLGEGVVHSTCLTSTHGWVSAQQQVISFNDTGAVPHVLPDHALIGCTRDEAILHTVGTSHYVACKESCRVIDITNLRSTGVATIAGGKLHAIRALRNVLGVWRENLPPTFYTTTREVTPMFATSDGKVIDIVATTTEGVVVVRVPVK
ncbi:MAG: hypothetical protein JWP01_61 [Myxococcales bacterium]|nr:hypothetical protein [Myxococcales bacterium]